jgi:hypothetical protein
MKSRGQLENVMPGGSSWIPYAPQGVKGLDDDDDDESFVSTKVANLHFMEFSFRCATVPRVSGPTQ